MRCSAAARLDGPVFCGDAAENAGLAAGLDGADTGRAADCCSADPKIEECKREDDPSTGIFDARANFEHGRERWTLDGEENSLNGRLALLCEERARESQREV